VLQHSEDHAMTEYMVFRFWKLFNLGLNPFPFVSVFHYSVVMQQFVPFWHTITTNGSDLEEVVEAQLPEFYKMLLSDAQTVMMQQSGFPMMRLHCRVGGKTCGITIRM
jgi:hypothetical protein